MADAKIEVVPVAELIEDATFYPRHVVDPSHVARLARALEAGCKLPPVIANRKTKAIADGWHRARAKRKVDGPEATIEVEFRVYKSNAAMLEDAVRLNTAHGRPLDAMDLTRAAIMLDRAGLSQQRAAAALNISVRRLEGITVRVATAQIPVTATVPGTKTITLKRSVNHLFNTTLTDEQALAHDHMPGTSFLLLVRQLLEALQTGLVDREDARLETELLELAGAIRSYYS